MLFYIIKVTSTLKQTKVSAYCAKFFHLDFKSNYLMVQLKFKDINNNTYDIGSMYTLDISQKKSLRSYRIRIVDDWLNFNLQPYTPQINRVIFEYKYITKEDFYKNMK